MDIRPVLEKDQWESFVLKQNDSSVFQSWNWGEFERSLGNKFENLGIFRSKELVGLIPLKHVRAKRGRYLHIRHGPVLDFSDREIWAKFLDFVVQKGRREKAWFIRMSPLIVQDLEFKYIDVLGRFKESPMHDVDAEITWVLDLSKSEEEILKNMRKGTRYYIHKAERDGVEIVRSQDSRYLSDFWKVYADTVKRQRWQAYSRDYIEKEFEIFKKSGSVDLYLAKFKGKFIAASVMLYYGDQAIYHHSGTLSRSLKIPASYAIQWEAIREAKRRGLKWYNFWGISPLVMEDGQYKPRAGHPWTGLTFFKLGFGGQVRQFIHAKDLPLDWKYKFSRAFDIVEKWRRGY